MSLSTTGHGICTNDGIEAKFGFGGSFAFVFGWLVFGEWVNGGFQGSWFPGSGASDGKA